MFIRKILRSFFVFVLLFWTFDLPAVAIDPAEEIKQLKEEVQRLLERIEKLEKKQKESEIKAKEAEEKVEEVREKAEAGIVKLEEELTKGKTIMDKIQGSLKTLEEKTRVKLSGEIRFRADSTIADTPEDFVFPGTPSEDRHEVDYNSWPMRFRLNFESSVIPDYLDIRGRLTLNKRSGDITFIGTGQNPHDWMNSWAAHQSGDITPRLENLYAVAKVPYISTERLPVKLFFGRLPGYEGPPTRSPYTIFPRLFVDSEIEGGLINIGLPQLPFEDTLTEFHRDLLGRQPEPSKIEKERNFRKIARSSYFKKVEARNELYLGYLKYRDVSLSGPGGKFTDLMGIDGEGPDSDVFISQLQLKLTEDTQVFFNYAYMNNYYLPRYSFYETEGHTFKQVEPFTDNLGNELIVPYIEPQPYQLGGIWLDTQLWRFQVYGAFYYSHFRVSSHKHRWTFSPEGLAEAIAKGKDPNDPEFGYTNVGGNTFEKEFEGASFPGRAWFVGFNTGNLIHDKVVFWFDVTWGSKYWINPFNVKGYRRKGTVHYLSNNFFYNPGFSSDQIVAGYFPFSARVIDTSLCYYFSKRSWLLLGTMYFNFDNPRERSEDIIIGASGRKSYWYPHFEWKIFF